MSSRLRRASARRSWKTRDLGQALSPRSVNCSAARLFITANSVAKEDV